MGWRRRKWVDRILAIMRGGCLLIGRRYSRRLLAKIGRMISLGLIRVIIFISRRIRRLIRVI